jgi:3-oxoacyl-(acyl-carrier-protein) synthase
MRVAVTGMGVLSSVGRGLALHTTALREGKSALGALTLFDAPGIEPRPAGQIPDEQFADAKHGGRTHRLAYAAAVDALGGFKPQSAGLIALGTTTGGILETEQHYAKHRGKPGAEDKALLKNHALGTVADRLAADLSLSGERHTFATACSSSANAIGYAAQRVQSGAPWALAGGVDSLCRTTWCGFFSLKLLSAFACRPFDKGRQGLSLGEAAGFLLLESEAAAKARGAQVLGYVTGWGLAADAHHMTAPHPEGQGAARAMQIALRDAELEPGQIDYVNAHGTATPANDKAESLALRTVFGANTPPVSSTKGITGHTLGAAGAIEAVFSLLAIRESFLPSNVGVEEQDPECQVNLITGPSRQGRVRRVISNSFGFGGNNTAIIVEAA